jgi:hypothetical protein
MGRVTRGVMRLIVVAGLGMGVGSAVGCATAAEGPSAKAMSPAQAAQVADVECVGIPQKERELGILAYRDAMEGTRPLKVTEQVGKWTLTHTRGVAITLRSQPGMSSQWLARVATCHVALAVAGRGVVDVDGKDPLLVPGAVVRVDDAYLGFVVSVGLPDDATAADAMKRAHVLLSTPTSPAGPATAALRK